MNKIGILTIPDFNNYGNRLQNYAVQKVTEQIGAKSVSLVPYRPVLWKTFVKSVFHKDGISLKKKIFNSKKLKNFLSYDSSYVNTIEIGQSNIPESISKEYNCFVVGSDQVWNPDWIKYLDHNMFLRFAEPTQKISYAASFGVSELDESLRKLYSEALRDFKNVSVREDAGADIVESLTGKRPEVLIDPTMMLNREEWLETAAVPKNIDFSKEYILTYFLGGRSDAINNMLKKYSEEYGLNIYNLLDDEIKGIYTAGPGEFVYLVSHAKLVMTDSFHACVFSFLFGKPFLVFARQGVGNNMMSRLHTLLRKFRLERKYVKSGLTNELFECDYSEGYAILEEEKKNAEAFLKKALN